MSIAVSRQPSPRRTLLIILALGGLFLAAVVVWRLNVQPPARFITQPVVRGTLTQSASATGAVNPQDTISIGSQVSGTIAELLVDYNSRVHRGEILARIDPSTFQAQRDQAQAAFAQANAQTQGALENFHAVSAAVQSADADVEKALGADALARQTLERDRRLLSQGYIAQSQFDADRNTAVAAASALESARVAARQARLQTIVSDASMRSNAAAAQAAKSQLDQARLNLERTVIVSPVDGTVIARNVSVGQTIAASFQAPTLFTIAKDLTKMEVDIAVGEPDIGSIVPGAPVEFSVLAYPNALFHGVVSQVRENPTTIQNVVTYTVVSLVSNRDGRLRPGMTATAAIRVAQVHDALLVPLAALQWHPVANANGASGSPSATPTIAASTTGSPWGQTDLGASGAIIAGSTGSVYVDDNGTPRRVLARVDLVNGAQAAIVPLNAPLDAGDRVIVGIDRSAKTASGGPANPLLHR